jgi:hypothetical protein
MGFIALVTLGAAALILSPLVEKWKLQQSRYWITDQRVLQMSRDQTIYYMDLADVDAFQTVKGLTAGSCLVLGTSVFQDAKKYIRWRATHPKEDPEAIKGRDHVSGMILYNLNNAEAAAMLLKGAGCKCAE